MTAGPSPTYLPPDLGIRGHLAGLVTGTESLPAFNRWFVETVDQAEGEPDESAWEHFLAAENVLAEWTGGHLSAEETIGALQALIRPRPALPSENELRAATRGRAATREARIGRPNAAPGFSSLAVASPWAA